MAAKTKLRWAFCGGAIVYALGLLWLCNVITGWGQWYFAGPSHRQQTAAMLGGGLALSHNPSDLAFDLCWAEGGVQQVWGLGVPLWRLPFDLAARCFGQPAFPDGLVLAAALAAVAWLVFRVFFFPALDKEEPQIRARQSLARPGLYSALGGVFILLLFPPFLSLLLAGLSIHTEVLVYVFLYGVALICGLAALTRKPGWRRYWLLCGAAGAGGLVRPTLVYYGIATMIVATLVMTFATEEHLPAARLGRRLAGGAGLFVLGGMILWWTNYVRFGDGFEFGHRLNVQTDWLKGVITYSSRFDYPFQDEPFGRAARELWGALFQVQQLGFPTSAGEQFFPGQSPAFRYREFLFTTFDMGCAVLVAAGWVAGMLSARAGWAARRGRTVSPASVLALWSFLASAALALFYLRAPFLVDRYMMDFAPAFAAAALACWQCLTEHLRPVRWRWTSLLLFIALCSWLAWEFDGIRSAPNVKSLTWKDVVQRPQPEAEPPQFKELPARYQAGDRLAAWGIPFNGTGWDTQSGKAAACVTLFVNDPEFLEIELAPAPGAHPGAADVEAIRAKVGLEFLKRASIERSNDGWRLRFAGPARPRYQHGLQPVFIATVVKEHLPDAATPWLLKQVTWHLPGAMRQ